MTSRYSAWLYSLIGYEDTFMDNAPLLQQDSNGLLHVHSCVSLLLILCQVLLIWIQMTFTQHLHLV